MELSWWCYCCGSVVCMRWLWTCFDPRPSHCVGTGVPWVSLPGPTVCPPMPRQDGIGGKAPTRACVLVCLCVVLRVTSTRLIDRTKHWIMSGSVVYLCACLPPWSDSLRCRVHHEDALLLFVKRADRVQKVVHEPLAPFSKIGLVDIFDTLEIEQHEIMRKTHNLELGVHGFRAALQATLFLQNCWPTRSWDPPRWK